MWRRHLTRSRLLTALGLILALLLMLGAANIGPAGGFFSGGHGTSQPVTMQHTGPEQAFDYSQAPTPIQVLPGLPARLSDHARARGLAPDERPASALPGHEARYRLLPQHPLDGNHPIMGDRQHPGRRES
jgi:hypothetical protein